MPRDRGPGCEVDSHGLEVATVERWPEWTEQGIRLPLSASVLPRKVDREKVGMTRVCRGMVTAVMRSSRSGNAGCAVQTSPPLVTTKVHTEVSSGTPQRYGRAESNSLTRQVASSRLASQSINTRSSDFAGVALQGTPAHFWPMMSSFRHPAFAEFLNCLKSHGSLTIPPMDRCCRLSADGPLHGAAGSGAAAG